MLRDLLIPHGDGEWVVGAMLIWRFAKLMNSPLPVDE